MSVANCVAKIKEAYPDLNEATITEIANDVDAIYAKYSNQPQMFQKKLNEYVDGVQLQAKLMVEEGMQNALKTKDLVDYVTGDQFAKDPGKGLVARTMGTSGDFEGGRVNLDIKIETQRELSQSILVKGLDNSERKQAVTGKFDKDVYDQFKKMADDPDNYQRHPNPLVEKLVQNYKKFGDHLYVQAKRAGIDIPYRADWLTRQMWTSDLMLNKRTEWIKDGMKNFDLEAMGIVGNEKKTFQELGNIYDGIMEFQQAYLSESTAGKSRNVVNKLKKARQIQFKDGTAFMNMHTKWNDTNSIFQSNMSVANLYARRTAVTEMFGTQPFLAFDAAANAVYSKFPGNPKVTSDVKSARKALKFALFGVPDPKQTTGKIIKGAKRVLTFSQLQSVAIIGGISDIASTTFAKATREGVILPIGKFLNTLGKTIGSGQQKKKVLKKLERDVIQVINALDREIRGNQNYLGEGKFERGFNKTLTKLENLFSSINMGTWQFQNAKKTSYLDTAQFLGDTARKFQTWDKLKPQTQSHLLAHGLNEADLKIMKAAIDEDGYFIPANILELPLEMFPDKNGKPSAIARDKKRMLYDEYFTSQRRDSVKEKGLREDVTLVSENPDSVLGWIGTMFGQYKGSMFSFLRSVEHNVFMQSGSKSWGEALKSPRTYGMLGSYLALTTGLGYLAASLKEMIKGNEPLEWDDENFKATLEKSMLSGGALGVFGDLFLGSYEKMYRNPIADIAGPIPGKVSELAKIFAKIRAGEEISGDSVRLLWSLTPLQSFWLWKIFDQGLEGFGEGTVPQDMGWMD